MNKLANPQISPTGPWSVLLSLFRKLLSLFAASSKTETVSPEVSSVISEEESLLFEVSNLDSQQPGWYQPGLVAAAHRLLLEGTQYTMVEAIYGRDVAYEAAEKAKSAAACSSVNASSNSVG